MPPTKPQSNPYKKPQKKIKILNVKRTNQKSLINEYFYRILTFIVAFTTALLYALGYSFQEAAVIAVWIGVIIFVIWQIARFMSGEPQAPKKEKKPEQKKELAGVPKNYKPPEVPRVSKDFSPTPPAGDKRYPPPSPFIKPPK